jgi:hypothetical protein
MSEKPIVIWFAREEEGFPKSHFMALGSIMAGHLTDAETAMVEVVYQGNVGKFSFTLTHNGDHVIGGILETDDSDVAKKLAQTRLEAYLIDKAAEGDVLPLIKYHVEWKIYLEATSPREAARKALGIQHDPTSTATFFDVTDLSTGITSMVNMED